MPFSWIEEAGFQSAGRSSRWGRHCYQKQFQRLLRGSRRMHPLGIAEDFPDNATALGHHGDRRWAQQGAHAASGEPLSMATGHPLFPGPGDSALTLSDPSRQGLPGTGHPAGLESLAWPGWGLQFRGAGTGLAFGTTRNITKCFDAWAWGFRQGQAIDSLGGQVDSSAVTPGQGRRQMPNAAFHQVNGCTGDAATRGTGTASPSTVGGIRHREPGGDWDQHSPTWGQSLHATGSAKLSKPRRRSSIADATPRH